MSEHRTMGRAKLPSPSEQLQHNLMREALLAVIDEHLARGASGERVIQVLANLLAETVVATFDGRASDVARLICRQLPEMVALKLDPPA